MESVKNQFYNTIAVDKRDAFSKEFDATLPKLYEKLAVIYMEIYTQQDIQELLKFYETPIGKKMASNVGVIMEKSMAIGGEWGREELQAIMTKYMN